MADQIPEEAVEAAHAALMTRYGESVNTQTWHRLALSVLEAAAPAIREAEREQMRKGLHDLIMGPVWQWCISMVPEANTTYGVDAVGKCAELVQQWPAIDPETLACIDHGDRVAPVIADAVKAERKRLCVRLTASKVTLERPGMGRDRWEALDIVRWSDVERVLRGAP